MGTIEEDTRSRREGMLAGDLYIAGDPKLAAASTSALDLMDAYNATSVRQGELRRLLLEQLLGSIGGDSEIRPPLYVDYGSHVTIGDRKSTGLNSSHVAIPYAVFGWKKKK